jgi:molybdopterin molybdotransferase
MMTLETGVDLLLGAVTTLPSETIPLTEAGGRFLAVAATAQLDLPPFDNSAMDGYAVRTAEAQTGSRLEVIGTAPAGRPFVGNVSEGTCVRVFTGSPLPDGADAVVMQEDTRISTPPGFVEIADGVTPWENIRFAGEDVRRGTVLAPPGTALTPQLLGLLAAQGMERVSVITRPRVILIPNGSELVQLGAELSFGRIYESNTLALRELFTQAGCLVDCLSPPPDEAAWVERSLREGFERAEVVITIGGASVGEHDLIRPTFEKLGGRLDFWKLALKPGKPFFFGTLEGKFLFGLPGNPVSAFVTGVLLVLPALRKLQGNSHPALRTMPGVLAETITNSDRRRHFMRVATDPTGSVRLSGPQASHLIGSLAMADGLVDVPPETTLEAGKVVPVIRW